jgi:hypothetical protein
MSSPTVLAASEEHELALLLSGRCRRCAELVPGGTALRGRPCARCGEETLPSATDRTVLHALHEERATVRLWVAVVAVGVAALVAGWFPVLNSLLIAAALVWVRFTVVRPTLRLLTPRRRLVSRWTLRLAAGCFLALSIIFLEALTLIPALGALAKAVLSGAQVAVAGDFARRYLGWQLEREGRGEPVAVWEVGLLGGWLSLMLGLVAGLVAGGLWLLEKLGWVQGWMLGALPGGTP